MMRLLCINRFAPPDPAPTGRLLGDLRDELTRRGWEVAILSPSRNYRQGKGAGWRRWVGELQAHWQIFLGACLAKRPDVILCLTDPPCLPVTAMIVARLRGAKLAHWAMDVYPQIAAALGEVSPNGLLFRLVKAATDAALRRCELIACLDEDMACAMGLQNDPRLMLCPPWPPQGLVLPETPTRPPTDSVRWLYSGNLGRAHDFETLLQTQQILERAEAPFALVFQGRGPCRELAIQRAKELGLERCFWLDYAPDESLVESLLQAHVLVASQKPETRGLLLPSKVSLMRLLPRPIAWVGPLDGGVAKQLLADERGHQAFACGDAAGLAAWLLVRSDQLHLDAQASFAPDEFRNTLHQQRESAANTWHERLCVLLGRSRE
ncbi:MAG: hypothetical protein ACOYMN_01885 [Roseimicrobium sp.]